MDLDVRPGRVHQLLSSTGTSALSARHAPDVSGHERHGEVRVRSAIVSGLLHGLVTETDYRRRARAAGLSPDEGYHVVVMTAAPGQWTSDHWPIQASRVGALAVQERHDGRDWVVALFPKSRADTREQALTTLLEMGAGVACATGLGASSAGATGLTRAIRDAQRTAHLLLALGAEESTAAADELGPFAVFAAGARRQELDDVISAALAPLDPLAESRRRQLVETLMAWFDSDGSPKVAARRLGIHVNTVYARMNQVDELLGHGWRQGVRRLELETALRLLLLQRRVTAAAPLTALTACGR